MISQAVQLVVLSAWLGATAFFAAAVAPGAFAVMPTRTLAGAIVGRVLPAIFISGVFTGVVVVVSLARAPADDAARRGRLAAALIIGASCALGQFVIGPRIERLRTEIGGALETLAADDARRAAFGRLHGVSVGLMGVAMLAALVGVLLTVRAQSIRRYNLAP